MQHSILCFLQSQYLSLNCFFYFSIVFRRFFKKIKSQQSLIDLALFFLNKISSSISSFSSSISTFKRRITFFLTQFLLVVIIQISCMSFYVQFFSLVQNRRNNIHVRHETFSSLTNVSAFEKSMSFEWYKTMRDWAWFVKTFWYLMT